MKKPHPNQRPNKKRKPKKRHLAIRPDEPLTDKERLFEVAYLVDLNASRAYKAVKPNSKDTTCRTEGSRLLAKPNVRHAIDIALSERRRRLQLKGDAVLEEFRRIGYANMRDYLSYNKAGDITLIDSKKLSPELSAAISEVSLTTGDTSRSFRFRLHDKMDALRALAQHNGALNPNPEEPPKPGDPGTMTHFHTAIPFDEIRKKAEKA